MRALVTGAAGFIGSHLAERLRADGAEVIGVDGFVDNYAEARKRSHLRALASDEGFRLVEAMLEDLDLGALLDGVDVVFHLAAMPGVRSSWGQSFEPYSSYNVYATQRVLEAAMHAGVGRVVYASSSSVYGDAAALPMSEEARELPHSPYGVTKLAGEHLARLYHRNYGYPTVSMRFFTVYGPRQRPEMAIGSGEQTRDFTYVADTVEALVRAADGGEPGAVYNVGGGSTVSLNQLIATIEQVTDSRLDASREDAQRGDVGHTRADVTRVRQALDFVPAVALEEGLRRHWEWLQAT